MAFSKNKPNFMSMFQQKQKRPSNGDSEPEASSQQENSSQDRQQSTFNNEQQQQQDEHDESAEEPRQPSNKQEFSTSRFVAGVLRMIGFDASKLGALALNAIVMIAEAIGNAFLPPPRRTNVEYPTSTNYDNEDDDMPEALSRGNRETHQPRKLREGTPIDWYLENPNEGMSTLLNDALDSQLTDRITEMIERAEEREGGKAGCVKMLMCKSSPIIWGMQRAVSERITGRTSNVTNANSEAAQSKEEGDEVKAKKKLFSTEGFFAYFPTFDEFRKHATLCDERYAEQCNVDNIDDGTTTHRRKVKKGDSENGRKQK